MNGTDAGTAGKIGCDLRHAILAGGDLDDLGIDRHVREQRRLIGDRAVDEHDRGPRHMAGWLLGWRKSFDDSGHGFDDERQLADHATIIGGL